MADTTCLTSSPTTTNTVIIATAEPSSSSPSTFSSSCGKKNDDDVDGSCGKEDNNGTEIVDEVVEGLPQVEGLAAFLPDAPVLPTATTPPSTSSVREGKVDDVEIPESIQVLDEILSEFEEPESLPLNLDEGSPLQGNQSEDDGYMSMNGRKTKFTAAEEQLQHQHLKFGTVAETIDKSDENHQNNCLVNEVENIQTKLAVSSVSEDMHESPLLQVHNNKEEETADQSFLNVKCEMNPEKSQQQVHDQNQSSTTSIIQTTLPKIRANTSIPSKYSSLPCSGARNVFSSRERGVSCDGERNVLGIDISAVHNAVLRGGVAKLPEPILNEHPVTIYPGRVSPTANGKAAGFRLPPRTISNSVEKHREVCRKIPSDNSRSSSATASSSSSSTSSSSSSTSSSRADAVGAAAVIGVNVSPLKRVIVIKSPSASPKCLLNKLHVTELPPPRFIISKSLRNFEKLENDLALKQNNAIVKIAKAEKCIPRSDDEDFSDDSLEEQSLPPPPAPPTVPPTPSLSAPVTPMKRGSISWEINLDDNKPSNGSVTGARKSNCIGPKGPLPSHSDVRRPKNNLSPPQAHLISQNHTSSSIPSYSDSQSSGSASICTSAISENCAEGPSPLNTIGDKHQNSNWSVGDYPNHVVCSTEDEATSIYSDTEDTSIPMCPPAPAVSMLGKGTFVVRKGRKERQNLPELFIAPKSPSLHSHLNRNSNAFEDISFRNHSLLMTPNLRHSVDLGISRQTSPQNQRANSLLSPRSRLSLDLEPSNTERINGKPSVISSHHLSLSGEHKRAAFAGGKSHSMGSPYDSSRRASSLQRSTEFHSQHQQQQHQQFYHHHNNSQDHRHHSQHHSSLQQHKKHQQHQQQYKESGEFTSRNGSDSCLNIENNHASGYFSLSSSNPNVSTSVRQTANSGESHSSTATTPRRELAPPLEEDEEQYSESQSGCAPLRQIENNISALLRGDMAVVRVGDLNQPRRSLGFRPGVHKSESAKEMLLSQNSFGPLPPTPTSSSPELADSDGLPPLPPSPTVTDMEESLTLDSEMLLSNNIDVRDVKLHTRPHFGVSGNGADRIVSTRYVTDELPALPLPPLPLPPPAIPPHRSGGTPLSNTIKARSIDSNYTKKCSKTFTNTAVIAGPGTLPCELNCSSKRTLPGSYSKRTSTQTPRDEIRLQTSCSLPETPIFARGSCDIARTPHRRPNEGIVGGSRTAPRSSTNTNINLGSSVIGIGNTFGAAGYRQRSINQALASGEMLRLTGGPARGWYPKQRSMRPASTENLDRLHRAQQSASMRAWDGAAGMSGTGHSRKPLTLPPNLTPTFLNKSPREALRRVTSLLIKGKANTKERDHKKSKENMATTVPSHHTLDSASRPSAKENSSNFNNNVHKSQKKKGFFKNFWKKSKHYSLDQ